MSSLPAGWYKDPADTSTQRYWDGEGWLAEPDSQPTADDVVAHLSEVTATDPYTVPGSIFEEVFAICERLGVNALQ